MRAIEVLALHVLMLMIKGAAVLCAAVVIIGLAGAVLTFLRGMGAG